MKLNRLSLAILLTALPTSSIFAAGLDRSGQSISAFLQNGNYAEAGITVIDPTVKGQDNFLKSNVSDMAEDYYFPSAAVKVQVTDKISLGLLYDQPFGADAEYSIENPIFEQNKEGTAVTVKTENITALIGYQPNENWNIYAGPAWQTVEANVRLRGKAYGGLNYNLDIDTQEAWGWVAGFAYSIPDIALKAALTYRSEIEHEATSKEKSLLTGLNTVTNPINATTPQSVNLDLQTGIAANTIAFANIRWVEWSQFAITPKHLQTASGGANLLDYSKDQWSANVGVGRKFNEKWSGSALVSYDTGAGNPVTTLGPTEGYWGVGLGGQYSPEENYFIQAGIRYLWLGDATAKTGTTPNVGSFSDNNAIAYGLKIGYRF